MTILYPSSLPAPCDCSLPHHPLNSSPPHHRVYCFSAVCDLFFGLPFPPPCGAEISFVLTIVFFLLFAVIVSYPPRHLLSLFTNWLRRENNNATTLFAYPQCPILAQSMLIEVGWVATGLLWMLAFQRQGLKRCSSRGKC